jgi:hypothetical protein
MRTLIADINSLGSPIRSECEFYDASCVLCPGTLDDVKLISTVAIHTISRMQSPCVGYLAHPFVKRMVLLLISSFVSQL